MVHWNEKLTIALCETIIDITFICKVLKKSNPTPEHVKTQVSVRVPVKMKMYSIVKKTVYPTATHHSTQSVCK